MKSKHIIQNEKFYTEWHNEIKIIFLLKHLKNENIFIKFS